jgi:aspartate aminotransferase-like enzyme
VVSNQALKKSDWILNKGMYFDFQLFKRYQKKAETPMTPPIPQIFGLRKILEIIDQNGGKQIHFNHYLKVNNLIKEQIKKLGLSLFPQEEYASPTISCINAPSTPSTSEIYEMMREKGYELAKGHGTLQDKTFRIGNMGHISLHEVDRMLRTLKIIINS